MQAFTLQIRSEVHVAVPQGVLDEARRSTDSELEDDAFMLQLLSQALTQRVREGVLRLEEAGMGVRRGPVEISLVTPLEDGIITRRAAALLDLPEKRLAAQKQEAVLLGGAARA
jgi:hypothetical protein